MKLTKFTNYTVELTVEEFDIIACALSMIENEAYDDAFINEEFWNAKRCSILYELYRRFTEKE